MTTKNHSMKSYDRSASRQKSKVCSKAILCILLIAFALPILSGVASASTSGSFRFIAWGDTKSGTSTLTSESKIANGLNPAFTLYEGDLCDSGPNATCFATWKYALNGGGTNNLFNKTFATRGNHDSSGGTYWQSAFEFADTATRVGATNYSAQTQDMTYSFDYGNSHFVGIDLPGGDISTMSSAEITWLDNDLTAAEGRGLTQAFLFWHGPIYYVDGHHSTAPAALITALNKHPIVSAGFYGHEHLVTYTHIDSSRISNITHPFEEFISGAAGAGLYTATAGRYDYWLNSGGSSKFGFVAVDVSSNNFTVSVYKIDGSVDKTFSFSKGPLNISILSYYRGLGSNPNVVETTDLLKASDDWSRSIAPPGFTSPISTQQLLTLADEWSKNR